MESKQNPSFKTQIPDLEEYVNQARSRVRSQAESIRAKMLADTEIWGTGESAIKNEKCFNPLSGSISLQGGGTCN